MRQHLQQNKVLWAFCGESKTLVRKWSPEKGLSKKWWWQPSNLLGPELLTFEVEANFCPFPPLKYCIIGISEPLVNIETQFLCVYPVNYKIDSPNPSFPIRLQHSLQNLVKCSMRINHFTKPMLVSSDSHI